MHFAVDDFPDRDDLPFSIERTTRVLRTFASVMAPQAGLAPNAFRLRFFRDSFDPVDCWAIRGVPTVVSCRFAAGRRSMDEAGERDGGGFVTVSSRIAYENRWLRLREDVIRRPDGSDGLYGVVERNDFVVVAALGEDGCVTLVEQFRYPVGRRMWELPMGMWEERPDATPAQVAAGELAEETGLVAGEMAEVGTLFQGAGYSNQRGRVFVATVLTQGAARREASEGDMVARRFAVAEVESMIGDGRITCMVTVAAFGLLRIKGLV